MKIKGNEILLIHQNVRWINIRFKNSKNNFYFLTESVTQFWFDYESKKVVITQTGGLIEIESTPVDVFENLKTLFSRIEYINKSF